MLDDVVQDLAARELEAIALAPREEIEAVDEVLEVEDRGGLRLEDDGRLRLAPGPSRLLERLDHREAIAEARRVDGELHDLRGIDDGEAVAGGLGVLHRGHDDADPGRGQGGHVLHVDGRVGLGDGLVHLLLEVGEGVAVDRARDREEEPVVLVVHGDVELGHVALLASLRRG